MTGSAAPPALLVLLRGMLRGVPEAREALATVDWEALVAASARHALPAVVQGELARLGLTAPAPQAERLAAQARRVVAGGLQARALLRQAVGALAAEGVVPVLLKGYGLASRLYPQPLARPLSDVDLLVAPDEVPRAERALASLGLQRSVDPGEVDVYTGHHHVSFSGAPGLVELHFRALSGFGNASLEYAHLAPALREARLDGLTVRYLGAEDELVYLATHAAGHLFLRLGWLLDVALLLQRSPGLDWERVARTAEQARLRTALGVACGALERALAVPLPPALHALAGAGSGRARRVVALLDEAQLVSGELAQSRVRAFLLRALMADEPASVGLHVAWGALRWSRRAVLQRLQRPTPA